MNNRLVPRGPVPGLKVPLLGGGEWDLANRDAKRFFMLVFYRGYHCPICRPYLLELKKFLNEFTKMGVNVLALSSDTKARAELAQREWGLSALTIGYDLSIDAGREWGLFVSTSRGKTSVGVMEPDKFTEPGLFLLRSDKTLYASLIQTMPFARSSFADLAKALVFIIDKAYPARGEA